jgi:hypothetical protein
MMDKQKMNADSLQNVLNLLLLARSFGLETDRTIETSAKRIENLHQPYHLLRLDMAQRITTNVIPVRDAYDFSVSVCRRSQGVDLTTVQAHGHIIHSEDLESTLIHGHIRLGWLFLIATFGVMLCTGGGLLGIVIMGEAPAMALIAYMVIIVPLTFWFGWLVRKDYQQLTAYLARMLDAKETKLDTAGAFS